MWWNKYKKTNFEAGDLIFDDTPLTDSNTATRDPKFVSPRKLDFRDMCISTSNQLQTPHCAGYSTAGHIEVLNWKVKHYPEQEDGDAIYKEAKTFDGYDGPGTFLKDAVQAAINLNLVKGVGKYIAAGRKDVKFAIHQYTTCVAGFNITNEWNEVEKKTGYIRDLGDQAVTRGGHAVLICGYDEHGIYIQNSWGEEWGIFGFAILRWEQFDRQFRNGMVIVTE